MSDQRVEKRLAAFGKRSRDWDTQWVLDQLTEAQERERVLVEALNRQWLASETIRTTAKSAYSVPASVACPHGNIPFYPVSGVWCDGCFDELEEAGWQTEAALRKVEALEEYTE